jgi:broad specificity phosphatase PhoE
MTSNAMTNRQSCDALRGAATSKIALLRHAQTDLHGRFCGHSDPNLSIQGRQRIPSIIQSLSRMSPKEIYSSDLRRAIQTAEPIAKHFGLDYTPSRGFREMNFGSWEGLTWKEVELQYPEDARAWAELFPHHRPPGGESFSELQTRVSRQLEQLATTAELGCTLVITHAGFIRTAVAWVLRMPDESISRIGQNYGAVTILEKTRQQWVVAALNVTASCLASGASKEDRP